MPIPGRMPTKDMCARALASLRLSALPSCRAPLSPLGSRASRLCGQRLRAGRGCSPPPRHVADGHPACHRARPRRTGGRDLAQAGCVHGGRCESGSNSLQRVQYPRPGAQVAPQTAGRLALSGEHPSVLPGQAGRDEMATTDAARLSAILSAKVQGDGVEYTALLRQLGAAETVHLVRKSTNITRTRKQRVPGHTSRHRALCLSLTSGTSASDLLEAPH